jgi:DNA recombination-dependent growth factor C
MLRSIKYVFGLVSNINENTSRQEASDILMKLEKINPKIFEQSIEDAKIIVNNTDQITSNNVNYETNLKENKLKVILEIMAHIKNNNNQLNADEIASKLQINTNRELFVLDLDTVIKQTHNPDTISGWIIRVIFNYLQKEWFNIFILVCILYILYSFYELIIWLRIKIANKIMPNGVMKKKIGQKLTNGLFNLFGLHELF